MEVVVNNIKARVGVIQHWQNISPYKRFVSHSESEFNNQSHTYLKVICHRPIWHADHTLRVHIVLTNISNAWAISTNLWQLTMSMLSFGVWVISWLSICSVNHWDDMAIAGHPC